jgi:deoxyribodipyrimidine photo-lyase
MTEPKSNFSSLRIRKLNDSQVALDREFVLYWMTAYRRSTSNYSLQRAVDWAAHLGKPLLILEAVRVGYQWACDRFHQFLIDGMIDNQKSFGDSAATYYPYIEKQKGDGHGLVESLCKKACVVVSDDFPCFFHPAMYDRIAKSFPVSIELVDANGFLPMRAADRTFTVAHSYRRYMQKLVHDYIDDFPQAAPLSKKKLPRLESIPAGLLKRWPMAKLEKYEDRSRLLTEFNIDHTVTSTEAVGGPGEAKRRLKVFLKSRLENYQEGRNRPEDYGSTGLSPYLHFGHLSTHEILEPLLAHDGWNPTKLAKPNGSMNGFWNCDPNVEALLDQLLTWREIGFNMCWREKNYAEYESLPQWAQKSLEKHAKDKRPVVYSLEQFELAKTHDDLWNAAQRQLVREGIIHNYLRMLWGKKILEWTPSPRQALDVMIELNNKYALDGRDPNSYSGIFWILGRYDRAWGPERPIFGSIRYMTSDSTRKKFPVKNYIARYSK